MDRKKPLEKHTFICVSDSLPEIEGYRASFAEVIDKLDHDKYQSVIADQGIIEEGSLLFISFTFVPKSTE